MDERYEYKPAIAGSSWQQTAETTKCKSRQQKTSIVHTFFFFVVILQALHSPASSKKWKSKIIANLEKRNQNGIIKEQHSCRHSINLLLIYYPVLYNSKFHCILKDDDTEDNYEVNAMQWHPAILIKFIGKSPIASHDLQDCHHHRRDPFWF